MHKDLQERLFDFAVKVLKYLKKLPNSPEFKVIRYQLAKSATSSGANYDESQAGSSKADFNNKVRIALREMRESNYWLRLIKEVDEKLQADKELIYLIDESKQLKNILGSIVTKTNKPY